MNTGQANQICHALSHLECPQCGGRLLRGPRALYLNQNLTCVGCTTRFAVTMLDKTGARFGIAVPFPMTDVAFRENVDVVLWQVVGTDPAGAAFHDPSYPPRNCDYEPCGAEYTGPGVYCCPCCAIADA